MLNSICLVFYFYSNLSTRLSRALVFLLILVFRKQCTLKESWKDQSSRWRTRRMHSQGVASQCVGIRIFAFASTLITWHANVACEMVIAVISLFKLMIWKALGKPYPFINYYQPIEDTRIIENKSQPLHKPCS